MPESKHEHFERAIYLTSDYRDLIELFNLHKVNYLRAALNEKKKKPGN